MANAENKNLHSGHRQRVKERFLNYGLDSFTDVQFLETLLFYGIQRKDTNEIAHLLLKRFNSLKGVFEASYEDILEVDGVTENAASLLRFFPMASKKYLELAYKESKTETFNTPQKLKQYCMQLFLSEKKEMVYGIALDCDLAIVGKETLNSGSPDSVFLSYRKLTEFIHKSNTSRIVITHNHPNGTEMVSRADIDATRNTAELLYQISVELVDHIVVGKTGATSMREEGIAKDVWEKFGANGFQ